MTVTDVTKDPERRTLTLTSHFAAPVARVWQIWEDPRQLERWWGPPTYPATVLDHDLTTGGRVRYLMTGPDGAQFHGWWQVREADAPHLLEFEDGFADEHGTPDPALPVTVIRVTLAEQDGGTRMQVLSTFASTEAMEQLLAMGMEQGMVEAAGQIDGVLSLATA